MPFRSTTRSPILGETPAAASYSRKPLRVGTSYVNAAQRYYDSIGREAVIIPLHGSVELAPLTDLSDVIVETPIVRDKTNTL